MEAVKQTILQDRTRYRGHRGGVIPMHRALAHYVLSRADLVTVVLLVLLLSFIWMLALPQVCLLWIRMMDYGIHALSLHADLHVTPYRLSSYFQFFIPYPSMDPILPDPQTWRIATGVTIALFAGTFFTPNRFVPVIYLLRGILFIQATAQAYFALIPAEFPHTPNSYLEGLFASGLWLISMIPVLYGFTYFIFQFTLSQKIILTAITMTHLTIFLPLQLLLQALILQKTVLFMPVLYIVFGLPLDVLIIIAFYSWGMTWNFKSAAVRALKVEKAGA
jgi:hypothetical protein